MMLSFIVESAVRSLGLGIAIWIALRMFRVRSLHVQSLAWTGVLLSALTMPLLMALLEAVIKSAPAAAVKWTPPSLFLKPLASPIVSNTPSSMDWLRLASFAYVSITAVFLFRMAVGLFQGWRLRNSATSLKEAWTSGMDVRVSGAIGFPATIGRTVLLPPDWTAWSALMRTAVFVHERSHVRRGDFYVQALAGLHRAIFWFNPLAWWLERHLTECAEAISDDAAIQEVQDRVSYAEILIQLAGKSSRNTLYSPAMARGRTVVRRIERVLRETELSSRASWIRRTLTAVAILPLVALAAGTWLVEKKVPVLFSVQSVITAQGGARGRAPQQPPVQQQSQPVRPPAAPAPQEQSRQYLSMWPQQEVPDIITTEEHEVFDRLRDDVDREQFIEEFWKRRDPTPDTFENEFRDEYYRRIVVANQRYTTKTIPGWQTDRGRILIMHGQPDEIETHAFDQPPVERWRYRFVEGVGPNVILEFKDPTADGSYRLQLAPADPPLLHLPGR